MGAVMQFRNIVLCISVVSVLAGCALVDRKQVDYKAGAVQPQPLEVPPDLTVPETEQRYTIPGTDGEKIASYSEYAKPAAEQPCVAPVNAPAAVPVAAAKLQEVNGVQTIQLPEPFDRSWRKVGLALERARIAVADRDRANGIYFIPAPGKSEKKRRDYQVTVREQSGISEIAVNDGDGESNKETARIIEALYQNLEK
ncbi:MAG TPA: outer membrane protein assembly factor BamC [Sideroxyarcus sp.]|nr:outer membrane protein assembly factor BamC [Sideroxyarcus sp.]